MNPTRLHPAGLLLILATGSFPAGATGGPARVVVSVEPDKLLLGDQKQATVRVRVVNLQGSPVDGARIRLRASVGRLEEVAPCGPGEVTAIYRPPERFFPQIAILMAVAAVGPEDTVHGRAVLPLWGRGEARVYSRPRVPVKVSIAGREYGPVTTDRLGVVSVPVEVPPGYRKARAGKRTIELDMPPMKRIGMMAGHERLAADGTQSTVVRVYVVAPLGKPDADAAVEMQAGRGSLDEPRCVDAGVFEARYTPPTKVGDGRVEIAAVVRGERGQRDEIDLALVPGEPAGLELAAEPGIYRAGSGTRVRITARVFDAGGNPAPADLHLGTDLGAVDKPVRTGPGCYQSAYAPPDYFGGKQEVRLRASTATGVRTEAGVTLRPAVPAGIRFDRMPGTVLADGKSATWLVVAPCDAHGNPVPGARVEASASKGDLSIVDTDGDGRTTLVFVPPLLYEQSSALLQVSAGRAHGVVQLDLVAAVHPLAASLRAGYLTNFGNLHAPCFTAELDLHLPFLGRGFFLRGAGGYYFYRSTDEGLDVSSSLHGVAATAALVYRLEPSGSVYLQAALGGGALVLLSSTSLAGDPAVEERTVLPAVTGSVGAGLRAGPGWVNLRLGYLHARSPGSATVSGEAGGLSILAGYELGLF